MSPGCLLRLVWCSGRAKSCRSSRERVARVTSIGPLRAVPDRPDRPPVPVPPREPARVDPIVHVETVLIDLALIDVPHEESRDFCRLPNAGFICAESLSSA